jgi:hypothetical protein
MKAICRCLQIQLVGKKANWDVKTASIGFWSYENEIEISIQRGCAHFSFFWYIVWSRMHTSLMLDFAKN